MEVSTNHFLKFVPFSKFDLWDTKRYTYQNEMNFDNVVRLSEILIPYKKSVSKEEIIKNNYQIIAKINFGGELFLREKSEIETYKGGLFLVPSNSIIYSKINVRHGCIYFNDENSMPFGVSSEYPVFTFDPTRVNGYFLQKLLRTDAFKKLLNTKSTGISKARVKQDEFLDIQIPLPTLQEQQEIVEAYFSKINEANQLELEANNIDQEIEMYFLNQLGLKELNFKEKVKGLLTVDFKDLDRWDYFSGDYSVISQLKSSNYSLFKLGDIYSFAKRSFNKKTYSLATFKYIEIGAIDPTKGILEAKEIKTEKAPSRATQIVKKGDLILGLTRPYLKKFALVTQEYDDNICSSGFSVIEETKDYYLTFLLQFLKCSYGIEQLKNRMTGGLYPAITEGELKEIKIPLPDIDKQIEIMNSVNIKVNEIVNNKVVIEELKHQANEEFEKAIFQ